MVKRKRDKLKMKLHHFIYYHKKRGFKIDASYDELLSKLIATQGRCSICCKSIGINNLTGDMINPSRKKIHNINDIQFICRFCNSAKNAKDTFFSIGFIIENQRLSWYFQHNPFREYMIDNKHFRWVPYFKNVYKKNICLIFLDSDYAKLRVKVMSWKKYPRIVGFGMKESDYC